MGVLYKARDLKLHRIVALKFVRVVEGGQASALGEARALASLSHENVVPVFDVGVGRVTLPDEKPGSGQPPDKQLPPERIFIVMELVHGLTLREWVEDKSRPEILKAFVQAARALVAAHTAGLVHRDFKPENVLVGDDGRVRVVDFGLACEASHPDRPDGRTYRAAGTPKYMAPEQRFVGPVTAAADQYGFCVSLAEALSVGESAPGPVPGWLQTIIKRGREIDPADRFPSMNDLLKALGNDPAVVRRRWITAAVLAAGVAAAFVAGRAAPDTRAAACARGGELLASVWGDAGRDAALDRIGGFSNYGRSVRERLAGQLREHAGRWADGYKDACLARGGAQSHDLVDRRMACLERGRAALKSVAGLVQTADQNNLPGLLLAARELPDPDGCGDLESLITSVEPPARAIAARVAEVRGQLAATRMELAAGRNAQARASAEQVVQQARKLGYQPLVAEALLIQGRAIMSMDDRLAAIAPLTEAFTEAMRTGDRSLAVEAWARRAWTQGTATGQADSLAGVDVIEAAAAHKSVSPFARALLHNNIGCVEVALEHRDRAKRAFELAVQESRDVGGEGANELLNARLNLVLVTDDPEARDALLTQVDAERSRAFGADHPETLEARRMRGMMAVSFRRAVDLLAPACGPFEMYNGARAMRCWAEVGFVRRELGDDDGAVAAVRRATSVRVAYDTGSASASPYLRLWLGDAAGAAGAFGDALAVMPRNENVPWWTRLERADLELGRGRALRAIGRNREARRVLENSLRELLIVVAANPDPEVERRAGRARAELATVLSALHAPSAEVARTAGPAAAWLRRAGGMEQEIRELERLAGSSDQGNGSQ
jgi:tetratricopeptide (TPR) repeat protein